MSVIEALLAELYPGCYLRAVQPIVEFHDVDRSRFEAEIVPRGRPAVLRGLVADWPAVAAAKAGEEALADFLRKAASDEPFEAWFGPPEIGGRFGYNDRFRGLQSRAAAGDGRSAARPFAPPTRP